MEKKTKNPLRILQVFYSMYPGGAESMIMNLYRCIDKNYVQFDFIVHSEQEEFFDQEIQKMGGRIYRVPRYNGSNYKVYSQAWELFFQNHPEYHIIHAHLRSSASIYLTIAQKHGLITIAHSHSTSEGKGIQALVKRGLELPLRHIADYFFGCSKEAGQWLFGKKIVNNNHFYILKNAVDTERFQFDLEKRVKIRKELDLHSEIVIGHVGRFVKVKNHAFLINVFHALLKKIDAKLILVGEGELLGQIKEDCRQLHIIDKVCFLGNRVDVNEIMSAMDVFLFPSLYEGLPVVLVEAQAGGLPCLAANHITEEVALGNLYYLSLNETPDKWADKLLELSKIKADRCLSIANIKDSGFDIHDSAEWLKNFYLEINQQ